MDGKRERVLPVGPQWLPHRRERQDSGSLNDKLLSLIGYERSETSKRMQIQDLRGCCFRALIQS